MRPKLREWAGREGSGPLCVHPVSHLGLPDSVPYYALDLKERLFPGEPRNAQYSLVTRDEADVVEQLGEEPSIHGAHLAGVLCKRDELDEPGDETICDVGLPRDPRRLEALGVRDERNGDRAEALRSGAKVVACAVRGGRASLGASIAWAPAGTLLSGWQYAPSASLSGSQAETSGEAPRRSLGLQAAHSVSRNALFGDADSVTASLTQSGALLRESLSPSLNRAIAHSASLFWQSWGSAASQTFAGLTLSDSIVYAEERGRFQMVNLQLSRRTQLSRASNWSANLTLQGTRNESSQVDPFSGERRTLAPGWQQYHSGTVSYEHQRAFDVPRLRLSLLASANSQQLEQRAAGDIDAPVQRIDRSLEARLDYSIGRLDTRLSARQAVVDGRAVSLIHARAQRRF